MIEVLYFAPILALSVVSILSRELPRDRKARAEPGVRQWSQPVAYYFTKALPMLWMLGFYGAWYVAGGAVLAEGWSRELKFWVLLGLALGVVGDIFLLFRGWFLPGFVAFAAGHVYYLVGFAAVPWVLSAWAVALAIVPAIIYGPIVAWLTPQKKMLAFVLSYMILISGMLLAAINASVLAGTAGPSGAVWGLWGIRTAGFPLSLAVGAALFCVSDGCWSWNKFVRPLPYAGVWVLSTYYAGQAFIVWGAMQFP